MASRRTILSFAIGLFAIVGLLLWNLGAYGLWDDEANTALFALGVWKTGDTTAWDGSNIVAYRNGLELSGIKNRAYPPLQYFVAAPFLGLFGRNAWAARIPFALAALVAFAFWARWLLRERLSAVELAIHATLVLGNVSLFLYSRQSRYYALAWGLTFVWAYLYVNGRHSKAGGWFFCITGVVLLAAHYLSYAAAVACLAVDYLLFEFRKREESWKGVATFAMTQAVGLGLIVGVFFPFGRKVTPYVPQSWWADKLRLFWWNIRDLNACEFFWLPMLLAAGVVAIVFRDRRLLRAVIALITYAFAVSVLSPQPVGWAVVSDIRYMVSAIPLCIFISARSLTTSLRLSKPSKLSGALGLGIAGVLSFWTWPYAVVQELIGAPTRIELRSTLVEWLGELRNPQRSAYKEVSEYLSRNIRPSSLAYVLPEFATYPLMFHAPSLRYMWQFSDDKKSEYPMLPETHFQWHGIPDALVGFGPAIQQIRAIAAHFERQGVHFAPEVWLDAPGLSNTTGQDNIRPELFWRAFHPVHPTNRNNEGALILVRVMR